MDNCKFCNGEPIPAEYETGHGTRTVGMMIEMLMGGFLKSEKREYAYNGIQLKNGNILTFDNSACEYTGLGIEIKYCPFCGMILQHKEGENDG